jgi:tRNA pseudouridine38-40 synthase
VSLSKNRNIKLVIAYDGTDFCGWQKQTGRNSGLETEGSRTVQAVIEAALERMHRYPVVLSGSGRTDSGVHAVGQVAGFRTGIDSIQSGRFRQALNGLLPQDVRILEASEACQDFHARFDARTRTYRYHFIAGRQALPHENRYALQLWYKPRIDVLNSYCRLLLGEHDFSVFASSGDSSKSGIRHISHAAFFVENNQLIFEISANAFLWKMIRSVAGTFLRCEQQSASPEFLREIIVSRDRNLSGPTLPPQGLFLWKIDYYRIAADSKPVCH